MARSTVVRVTSDISGKEVPEDQAWVMELTPSDGRRNKFQLDLTEDEAQEFTSKGREIKRRGRRPKSASS
jgi:hypothetical protein